MVFSWFSDPLGSSILNIIFDKISAKSLVLLCQRMVQENEKSGGTRLEKGRSEDEEGEVLVNGAETVAERARGRKEATTEQLFSWISIPEKTQRVNSPTSLALPSSSWIQTQVIRCEVRSLSPSPFCLSCFHLHQDWRPVASRCWRVLNRMSVFQVQGSSRLLFLCVYVSVYVCE